MTATDADADTNTETDTRKLSESQHRALQKFLATFREKWPPERHGPLPQPRATLPQKARPPPQAQPTAGDLELLTRAEVRAFLRISDTTLWRMARNGVLRPFKVGERRVAYDGREVRALVAERMAARKTAARSVNQASNRKGN